MYIEINLSKVISYYTYQVVGYVHHLTQEMFTVWGRICSTSELKSSVAPNRKVEYE